jgi:flagellar basal body P-ring formation protein FlgA
MDKRPTRAFINATIAWGLRLLLAASAVAATLAWADATPTAEVGGGLDSGLAQQVRQLALQGTRAGASGAPSRIEVEVGQLDPRLRLAPCRWLRPGRCRRP